MNKNSVPYVVIFTFVVCAAFVVVLAAANEFTKPLVAANQAYASHVAVLKAFGMADAETPRDEVERLYATVAELPGGAAWRAEIEGAPYLAVKKTGAGLWGSITAIVAADADAGRLRGFEVLAQQETPGLGGRIEEAAFTAQFRGLAVPASGKVQVGPAGDFSAPDKEGGRVDAVTGASRTSDFVEALVNAALADLRSLGGAK